MSRPGTGPAFLIVTDFAPENKGQFAKNRNLTPVAAFFSAAQVGPYLPEALQRRRHGLVALLHRQGAVGGAQD